MKKKKKVDICTYCNKNELEERCFRCDECASTAIMDPTKRNLPVGGATFWRGKDGEITRRP